MPVRYQRRATLCRAAGQAARGRLPVLAQRAGRPQGALPGFRGAAPAPRRAGAGGQGLEAHHHPPGRQGQRGAADQRGPQACRQSAHPGPRLCAGAAATAENRPPPAPERSVATAGGADHALGLGPGAEQHHPPPVRADGPGRGAQPAAGDLPGRDDRVGGPRGLSGAAVGHVSPGVPLRAEPAADRPGALSPVPGSPGQRATGAVRPVRRRGGGAARPDPVEGFPPGAVGALSGRGAPRHSRVGRQRQAMDFQQEQLARSLGEGHRVIHGVAGSGKTMILGYRCAHLAKVSMKPILVLCFNRSLAARLRQVMAEKGLGEKVVVQHFHGWCKEMLAAYNVDAPPGSRDVDAYLAALVERTMDAVERGLIPRAQYAAVMIDEGHDFEPDWFRLVVQMVDPSSNSLLVLYDDAQSIYRSRKKGLDFSFASVGIQAQGRTTVLKLNYRNTLEVLTVARAFADDLLSGREAGEDGVPIITPQSAGRRGAFPELIACAGDREEWELIVARLQDERDAGRAWGDMAILYRYKRQAAVLEQVLARAGIPFASGAGMPARPAMSCSVNGTA